MSLCLPLLAACSQIPVVKTKTVTVLPPIAMTEQIVEPTYSGNTNEDHLHYTLELRSSLRECNANLGALQEWRESSSGHD